MIRITAPKAYDAIERAVNARGPDYVYSNPNGGSCCNWHYATGEPGCIVGYALHLLGVDVKNHCGGALSAESALISLARGGIAVANKGAYLVFKVAQQVQDRRASWGIALAAANAAYKGVSEGDGFEDEMWSAVRVATEGDDS